MIHIRRFQSAKAAQQRGLTGPRSAKQSHTLARANAEAHVRERAARAAEGLADAGGADREVGESGHGLKGSVPM